MREDRHACSSRPRKRKHWCYVCTLAEAYAENGNFKKAREWQAKAIELAPRNDTIKNSKDAIARGRMDYYKQNKPYHVQTWKLQSMAAREALIEMAAAGKREELKMALPHLRSDWMIVDGHDCISIGKWHVNLKKQTFVVMVDAHSIFAEYSSVFTQGKNGAWRAEITSEKHN